MSSCYLLFKLSVQNQAAFCTFFQGLVRFVQIPCYSPCKYFVILRTFLIHGHPRAELGAREITQLTVRLVKLSCRSHWVQTPERNAICMLCGRIVIIYSRIRFKIFISLSIKKIAILLKNMSAGKKDYTIR